MYEVIPLKGVGPVHLGMPQKEVRTVMVEEPITFRKSPDSEGLTDAFNQSTFQVFYDEYGVVEYIELSRSSTPVLYKGTDVFQTTAEEVVELISQDALYDDSDPELGYSYIFPDLAVSVWRPCLPKDDIKGLYFSTIGVGRKGYYTEDVA